MAATDKSQWAVRNRAKILTKDEYNALKELATAHGISFIGVKQFDGSAETVTEFIDTLGSLLIQFPKATDKRHKLELELSAKMDAEDFAITKNRTITLNANAYRDIKILQEEYKKSVNDGWFVKGTDYHAIIHHEFGHVVAEIYKIDPLKIACEITGLNEIETLKFIQKNLSKYAGSVKDGSEIIAEVFADMSTDNPSEFSRKFYSKVLEMIKNGEDVN